MAGLKFSAQVQAITTGVSTKTLLQILAPTNQKVKVLEISCSFNGTSNTATPIQVEVVRQTGAGTMTNTTTLRYWDPDNQETIQTTCHDTATVEPTDSGAVPWADYCHPQQGLPWQARWADEIMVNGAGRLGLRVTAGASVSGSARFVCEE